MNSKIKINPILLVLVFLVVLSIGYLAGCQSSPQYSQRVILNSGPCLENIQTVTDVFLKAWNEGDAEGCANTYAEDAIFMSPGQVAVEGRDAIQKFFIEGRKSANGAEMKIEEKVQEVIYFDDWTVMRDSGIIKVAETDSIEDKFTFKWAMLSKKNQEGKWESVWDILNDDNL
ncbi:MAG: nuclear transport factor 2 family protein [Cyclobacteriaceae bacterium]|nr:nuclear transport factor 2 family protein [Cyclobacteriaceae bacterium]